MKEGCPICAQTGGPLVRCAVCDLPKKPIGRAAPLEMANGLCDQDCPGHREEPYPGQLWPNENWGESMGHSGWHDERKGV